ncbi:LutC/YkgG family protein [Janthinobacterium aquaticum]|uniref:LutC/YkgG family protein n=1 Tax=Janthinobacterium sp. FT58W TaxID=2654254 RepID=UPI0012651BBA|nr:LUD domain-containing protein [Janthinobacterium sp. FT58W]KAB8042516.1 lactate utilization protein C [Janthinobacterium sp. FT58W]
MNGMNNARERMLGRLRASAPQQGTPIADIDASIDAHYTARRMAASPRSLLESMQNALRAAQAQVDCVSAHAWPALLAARLGAQQVRRLLMDTASAEGRALQAALPAEIEALPFARPLAEWKSVLFDSVDAGFTVARSGIAATGTLVIAPDAGTPRTVSLAPPLHVALVYASTLHADLHAAARTERWADGMPSNLVLISSPSKTSDIQQTLAYGAHGPRWLWVLLVDDLADGLNNREGEQP